jgi:hypothetical protein
VVYCERYNQREAKNGVCTKEQGTTTEAFIWDPFKTIVPPAGNLLEGNLDLESDSLSI